MNNTDKITSILKTIPTSPGVYQYFDESGEIIYVGKAKNLKRRVSSYFNKEQTGKTRLLVSKIADIRFTVVGSEAEAFLLENNFIKQYKPRYNIMLKDDKTYPWICIKNERIPRIFLTRKKVNDGFSDDRKNAARHLETGLSFAYLQASVESSVPRISYR